MTAEYPDGSKDLKSRSGIAVGDSRSAPWIGAVVRAGPAKGLASYQYDFPISNIRDVGGMGLRINRDLRSTDVG